MIEAISHLIHRDYEAIVEDFVTLQFIPKGTDLRPILPVLAKVGDVVCVSVCPAIHLGGMGSRHNLLDLNLKNKEGSKAKTHIMLLHPHPPTGV